LTALPLGNDTIVRLRATLQRDPTDNTLYRDWDAPATLTIARCNLQTTALSDKLRRTDNAEREFSETFARVYAPPDADVVGTDRIEFEGRVWEVMGEPMVWRTFTGRPHHLAFLIRLWVG
jgi:hypothetical protein